MGELRRTRIKSYRLDSEILQRLNVASKRAGKAENAFISELIEERLAIDPLIPAFSEIRMTSSTFQSILNASNIDSLEATASEVAQKNVQLAFELFRSNGRTIDFEGFVTTILGRYARWFYIEGNANLAHGSVTLRHEYGLKWSRFLKAYLVSASTILQGGKLDIKTSDQFVRLGLSKF
ncbi:MAG: hypothetical protein JRN09_02895 [Nitrososphaerota archaeon]|nr:hypothetical protein [Nitrososphaerota archaeon]